MSHRPISTWCLILALAGLALPLARAADPRPAASDKPPKPARDDKNVTKLFDGKTLKNWKSTDFGGEGAVKVENGQIIVSAGSTLSGVTWNGAALPKVNYEIELDAMKLSGSDFFLGLTFPFKENHASIILGGWGGSLVGISSIGGNDAANNEYMSTKEFPKDKWFHVRLRVTADHIKVWLEDADDPVIDVETENKDISTRADIDAAKPLGLSTYQTSAAYKNITLRKL
ncbi:MAG TPA: DUF1080 domain-containing protein [Tepidisphaeraceae bacterium]|jgi:hypothetical protein